MGPQDCGRGGGPALVAVSLLSGWGWSSGVQLSFAGYNLLNWHFVLGSALTLVVLGHALLRAKPLRRGDLAGWRQFLSVGAVALGAYAAWWVQRPVGELLELRGAKRRFTGSYERHRRGFQWVKWVVRIELHDGPDRGAAASTVWGSFTDEGRGAA